MMDPHCLIMENIKQLKSLAEQFDEFCKNEENIEKARNLMIGSLVGLGYNIYTDFIYRDLSQIKKIDDSF